MQKAYSRINWENYPSTETPLNETNLNKIDEALNTVDNRVVEFDTTKANQVDLLTCVNGITLNTSTGILTISFKNGTSTQIDTGLAKLAVNFDYDEDPTSPHYQQLILEMKDGTYKYIDLSAMITQFEFDNTSTVAFTVDAQTGHISAIVPDGSITAQKLNPNVVVTMQAIEDAAEADALKSEGHAVGEQNGVPVGPGSPYYHNNAKYYCEEAQGGGSGGHVIKDGTDTFIQRTGLKFMGKVSVTDDAVGNNTVVTVEAGGAVPHLIVLSEAGSTVRVVKGSTTIYATETSAEHFECDLEMDDPQDIYGTWTIHAVLEGDDAMMSLNVDTIKVYVVDDSHMHADITVTYPTGATVSCSMSGAPTQYATSSPYTFVVHSYGVWRITGTRGGVTETHDVTIYENGQEEEVTLSLIPDGSTVTPTDDIQLWLACAGIEDKPYTMLQQVLADSTTLLKVLTNDNASDYLARSTTWATGITADEDAMAIIGSYDYCVNALLDSGSTWKEAIFESTYIDDVLNISVPTMTSNTTPEGECFASHYISGYEPYKAFDKNDSTSCYNTQARSSEYFAYGFTRERKALLAKGRLGTVSSSTETQINKIVATNDKNVAIGSWDVLYSTTESVYNPSTWHTYIFTSVGDYKYYALYSTASGDYSARVLELDFLGRETGGVQSWLKAGGIQKSYTQLSQILGDTATLRDLMASKNAVDYLVTAKAFIDDICANQTAMSLIGANDYAADTLLSDDDWCLAIFNSTYADSVINTKVPTMTGVNTPYGEVVGSFGRKATNLQDYQVFQPVADSSSSRRWFNLNTAGSYIGYKFVSPTVVKMIEIWDVVDAGSTITLGDSVVKGSNDGANWDTVANINVPASNALKSYIPIDNDTTYQYYAIAPKSYDNNKSLNYLNFYGRQNGGIQTWLHAGGITNKFYTTLSEVLADTTTLRTLMASHDAVDYLVTAKAFIDDIVASETAMNYIGANDYASEKLLSNSDWGIAILNSAYRELVYNVKNPIMTSNTEPKGEASGSNAYNSDYTYYKAMDGNTNTNWNAYPAQAPQWIQYKFPTAKKCTGAMIYPLFDSALRIKTFKIQGSNDGSTYTDLLDGSMPNSSSYQKENYYSFTNTTAYQYYRLYCVDANSGSYDTIVELRFYGRENGGVQDWLRAGGIDESYSTLAEVLADSITLSALISSQDAVDYLVTAKGLIDGIVADATAMSYIGLNNYCANTLLADADWLDAILNSAYKESVFNVKVPTMTGYTTPSGTVTASGNAGDPYYSPWRSFNSQYGAGGGCPDSPSGWIDYTFPSAVKIIAASVQSYNGTTFTTKTFAISASNDQSTYIPLYDNGVFTANSQVKTFAITNNNSYTTYRISGTTDSNKRLGFGQIQFYGREDV